MIWDNVNAMGNIISKNHAENYKASLFQLKI